MKTWIGPSGRAFKRWMPLKHCQAYYGPHPCWSYSSRAGRVAHPTPYHARFTEGSSK